MNFLLYMLGRGALEAGGIRPTARRSALSTAATHAAAGRFAQALGAYRTLAGTHRGSALDVMIRAHLHLVVQDFERARHYFAVGMERVAEAGGAAGAGATARHAWSVEVTLKELLREAEAGLKQGRYARAGDRLRRARAFADAAISARAGMMLAEVQSGGNEESAAISQASLAELVDLSDETLRLLARICLVREVAGSLGQLRLREDLACWATSEARVSALMDAEYQRLTKLAGELPGHAETHYRLGLAARATGHLKAAATAFTAVLRLHPHHVSSATRLAATQWDLGSPSIKALQVAFAVLPETLGKFAGLARAAGDAKGFEASVGRLCQGVQDEKQRATWRGNLSFALCEVAELGPMWAAWREPSTALALTC